MSPLIADFRCWERPEVSILRADQKDRGLRERECPEMYGSSEEIWSLREFFTVSMIPEDLHTDKIMPFRVSQIWEKIMVINFAEINALLS